MISFKQFINTLLFGKDSKSFKEMMEKNEKKYKVSEKIRDFHYLKSEYEKIINQHNQLKRKQEEIIRKEQKLINEILITKNQIQREIGAFNLLGGV